MADDAAGKEPVRHLLDIVLRMSIDNPRLFQAGTCMQQHRWLIQ